MHFRSDRAANLPDRKRRRRMLADQAERLLIFRRGRIFVPEGTISIEILAEPRRLDRGKPAVDVVRSEERRHGTQTVCPRRYRGPPSHANPHTQPVLASRLPPITT